YRQRLSAGVNIKYEAARRDGSTGAPTATPGSSPVARRRGWRLLGDMSLRGTDTEIARLLRRDHGEVRDKVAQVRRARPQGGLPRPAPRSSAFAPAFELFTKVQPFLRTALYRANKDRAGGPIVWRSGGWWGGSCAIGRR